MLDLIPLADFVDADRNPKGHDLGAIHSSLDTFGWQGAVIVRGKSSELVAGHGRIAALRQRQANGDTPPKGIDVDDSGAWLVPAIRGNFRTRRDAERYLLADNRIGELGGIEDTSLLVAILDDLSATGDLAGTGYDLDDLDRLHLDMLGLDPVEPDRDPGASGTQMPHLTFGTVKVAATEDEVLRLTALWQGYLEEQGTDYGFPGWLADRAGE